MIKHILASLFLLMPVTFLAVDNINWNQILLYFASTGNLVEIKNALENGADIKANSYGYTALHLASPHGHENVIKFLLENGADIKTIDDQGSTALHAASRNGHENIVKLLLENGANIEAKDKYGCIALHIARTGNQNIKLLRLFSCLNKINFNSLWNVTLKLLSCYKNISSEIKFQNILYEIDKINSTKSALGFILNTNLFNKSPDKIKALVKLYKKLYLLRFQYEFDKNLENINKEFENIINDKPNNISTNIKALGLKNYYKEVLAKILAGYMLKEIHNLPSELVYKITQEF